LAVLSFFLVACLGSTIDDQTLNRIQSMSTQEFRDTVCTSLERNGAIIKCSPEKEEDNYKQATDYIETYGMPNAASLEPIVILPGMGGSALQAKISKHKAPHWWCWQNWDEWFRDWLPLVELLAQDCWFDNLRINYNATTDEYLNQEGVTIDTMDFGGLSGIDYLDYWFGVPITFTTYYSAMIDSFEKVGYTKGKNLFGAPYDWRLPSSAHALDLQAFNNRFLQLIETAYAANANTKVHVVTHSMGGPTALSFLNNQPQTWLNKYIASFIPIAAPWAGSAKALKTTLTGDNFGIEVLGMNLLNVEAVATLAKQAGGLVELVPQSRFYKSDYVFVYTEKKNYTAADFTQLYIDAGTPITSIIHLRTAKLFDTWKTPGVPVHCLYGTGFPTEISYKYNDGLDKSPEITYSNKGDGTVPLESLQECSVWKGQQRQPVEVKEFNLDHQNILNDSELFAYILNITVAK